MIDDITSQLQVHRAVIEAVERDMLPQIAEMSIQLVDTFNRGNKLLVMGNGGSAADSQHFVAEIVSRFKIYRAIISRRKQRQRRGSPPQQRCRAYREQQRH